MYMYTGKSAKFECLSPSETHISKLICCLGDTTGSSFGFNLSNVFTSIHVYRQSNALYTCLAHVYMQTLRCTCTISLLNEHVDTTVHVHVMERCHHWRSRNHWCVSDISIVHTPSFQWLCGHSCIDSCLHNIYYTHLVLPYGELCAECAISDIMWGCLTLLMEDS